MGVANEANRCVLVAEARRGIELIEDVAPLVRRIERGVDNREIPDLPLQSKRAEPILVVRGELRSRPRHRLLGERIESILIPKHRGLLIVVALDHRTIETANNFEAILRKSIVSDDVAHTDVMRAIFLTRVRENGLKRVKIGVNVAEDGKSHE